MLAVIDYKLKHSKAITKINYNLAIILCSERCAVNLKLFCAELWYLVIVMITRGYNSTQLTLKNNKVARNGPCLSDSATFNSIDIS